MSKSVAAQTMYIIILLIIVKRQSGNGLYIITFLVERLFMKGVNQRFW